MKKESKDDPPKRIFMQWNDRVQLFSWAADDSESLQDGEYYAYEFKGRVRISVHREIEDIKP